VDVTERVSTVLACVALDPQLSGVLLLDLDPALLFPLGAWLAELIGGQFSDDRPPLLDLSGRHTEEALWGRFVPTRDGADPLRWAPGPLDRHARRPGVFLVPDLTRLSLPAARAAVTLVGADVAHLERSQQSSTWHPRDRWLAALRREDTGTVSPHLLDRFSVRVDAVGLAPQVRRQRTLAPPAAQWQYAVRTGRCAGFPAEAAERVEALVSASAPGLRRGLALARMARALAGLEGAPEALAGHVDRAAALIGLWPEADAAIGDPAADGTAAEAGPAATPGGNPAAGPHTPPGTPGGSQHPAAEASSAEHPVARHPATNGNGSVKVAPGGQPEPFPLTPAHGTPGHPGPDKGGPPVPGAPYPEDDAMPRRVSDPLRFGWQRGKAGPARGYPIGTERARDLNDIAVVPTLLEALIHQVERCQSHYQEDHPLHVRVEDLRSYRRVPWTGHLLVLVLDHTCRAIDWDWLEPLAPYLSWAYVTRAQVGVVEVGTAVTEGDPVSEVRASEFRVRNLLDPRVEASLEPRPGRATPLAHGLALAAAILRHDTQQGGAPVTDARLVVVTDGRANVPLSNSQSGTPPANVGQQGIKDAEDAARAIRGLHRVQSVVISPGQRANGHLATGLAARLAAPVKHGGLGAPDDSTGAALWQWQAAQADCLAPSAKAAGG
jgi:magnesium chelatase subunit D